MQPDTVADVADALDVYIEMRVRQQPKGKRARHASMKSWPRKTRAVTFPPGQR